MKVTPSHSDLPPGPATWSPAAGRSAGYSALQVRALIGAVVATGASAADMLEAASATETGSDRGFIAAARYHDILDRFLAVTRDDAFGLHWGERAMPTAHDAVSTLAFHSLTLRDALSCICRCIDLFSTGDELVFQEDGDVGVLGIHFSSESTALVSRVHSELAMVSLVRLIRHFDGGDQGIREVHFAHHEPSYRAEYTRIFGGKEVFMEPFTEVVFDRNLLDKKQTQANEDMRRTAEAVVEGQMTGVNGRGGYARRVREFLADRQPSESLEMPRIAQALGLSERSLRRRLTEEGVPFGQLVREAQALTAQRLLTQKNCTIQEAAYELGFADSTSFHRAFKKWTGMTPLEYKRGRPNRTPAPAPGTSSSAS